MALSEQVKSLPEPADFYRGVSPAMPVLPGNILLFKRDRPIAEGLPAFHHRHVLINCLEGQGMVIVDGLVHVLAPGQSLLVFPFQGHHYGRFEPGGVCWLFTTFEFEDEELLGSLSNTPCERDGRDGELLAGLVGAFSAACGGDGEGADVLGFRLGELLARLARRAAFAPGSGTADPSSPRRELVRKVVGFVHERVGRRVSIADVAAHACLSPSRLRTLFREEVGVSLGEFIARNRIDRACALLGRSELNVSQVAAACGFDSIYAFSRAFSRRKGAPPTRYRAGLRRGRPGGNAEQPTSNNQQPTTNRCRR